MTVSGSQEFSVDIDATPLQCFNAIIDFDCYPSWSSAIQRAAVLEHDDHGVGRVVEFIIDIKFKRIRYVLEYAYKKPGTLTWRSVDGDIESINGSYSFEKTANGHTRTTCKQALSIGFWLPGPVRSLLERTALQQSVLEFKAEVERRHAGKPKEKTAARKKK